MDEGGGHDFSIALGLLNGNHAFGAASMAGVFGDASALAIAVFGGGQHALLFVFRDQHGDHALAFVEHHAAHATGVAAHGAHIVFVKTHGFAAVREQHHVVLSVRQCRADQEIPFVQINRNNAGLAGVAELVQCGLFDSAHAGGHENILVGREAAFFASQRQHDGDLLAFLQGKHVHNRAAARAARALRHFPHFEPVQTATVGEAQNVVVGIGYKQLVNPVVFFGGSGLLAAPPALLCAVFTQRLAFDIAAVTHGDHHVGGRDQIFGGQVKRAVLHQAAPGAEFALAKFLFYMDQFFADDGRDTLRFCQNVQQVFNLGHHFLVFGNDLVLLKAGQAL